MRVTDIVKKLQALLKVAVNAIQMATQRIKANGQATWAIWAAIN